MFDVNAGFLQAMHDFGLDTKHEEKVGRFIVNGTQVQEHFDKSQRSLFVTDIFGGGVAVHVAFKKSHEVVSINDPKDTDNIGKLLFDKALKLGFGECVSEGAQLVLVDMIELVDLVAFALLAGVPQALHALHALARHGLMSKADLNRAWLELKQLYRAERYSLLGYKGPEAQDAARTEPSVWNKYNTTPYNVKYDFISLVGALSFTKRVR